MRIEWNSNSEYIKSNVLEKWMFLFGFWFSFHLSSETKIVNISEVNHKGKSDKHNLEKRMEDLLVFTRKLASTLNFVLIAYICYYCPIQHRIWNTYWSMGCISSMAGHYNLIRQNRTFWRIHFYGYWCYKNVIEDFDCFHTKFCGIFFNLQYAPQGYII